MTAVILDVHWASESQALEVHEFVFWFNDSMKEVLNQDDREFFQKEGLLGMEFVSFFGPQRYTSCRMGLKSQAAAVALPPSLKHSNSTSFDQERF